MRCSDLRRQLTRLERLDRPSNEARAHLSQCAGCRGWYQQLLRVERQVPRVAVPPSRRKAAFLDQVRAGAVPVGRPNPDVLPLRPPAPRPSLRTDRDRQQQKLALATALAAGLLVFAASFGALQWNPTGTATSPGTAPIPTHPLVAKLEEPIKALPPDTPSVERMKKLVEVASSLHQQCHDLARAVDTSDLRALAGWYSQVFRPQLIDQARTIPAGERHAVLGEIASELDRFRQETEVVAAQAPDATALVLRDIAAVAGDASQKIRALI